MLSESEARMAWSSWTEATKRSFIEYHEFNPRFATYTWPMLPYPVQRLIMSIDEPEPQHTITGACGQCGYIRNLTGMYSECPKCGYEGLQWAYHGVDDEPLDYMREKLSPPELTEGDKADIIELERMFKL
jgi:hypothetical protein